MKRQYETLLAGDILRRALKTHAHRIAITADGRDWNYLEIDRASTQLARLLRSKGVREGDHVALFLRNGAEFVLAHLAIQKLGAARVPLNPLLAASEVAYMIEHSDSVALIAHTDLLHTLPSEVFAGPTLNAVIEVDKDFHDRLDAESADDLPRPDVNQDAPALIIYTGGTTGRPKGVVHTHRGIAINLLAHLACAGIVDDDHLFLCSPLPHSAHLVAEAALALGARVTISGRFDPEETLDLIASGGVTWLFMVPTMIYRMLDAYRDAPRDLSGLRTILYGAAPITEARLSESLEVFGPVLLQLFGQSEVPNFICRLSKRDHLDPALRASCGQPVPFCDVVLRDTQDRTCGAGEIGEIFVRSPYTLARYHKSPTETKDAFAGDWLATGDVGYTNATGHLFIVDRAKDMIITGGMNVYSVEVENVLQTCEGVRQVAVVGLKDADWGEAVCAAVVGEPSFSKDELASHARAYLAKYKVPKRIAVVDELPLTRLGKVDKKKLREVLAQLPDR